MGNKLPFEIIRIHTAILIEHDLKGQIQRMSAKVGGNEELHN